MQSSNRSFATRTKLYVSNVKWMIVARRLVFRRIQNPLHVILHYLVPYNKRPLEIKFRNRATLNIPENYAFQQIAETLLLNSYHLNQATPQKVIVDVGASCGDFTLLASEIRGARIYAYEPDSFSFNYLKMNVNRNRLSGVSLFNAAADRSTLETLFRIEERVDFLKVDCEGCEYDLLLDCPHSLLSRIRIISMEIHPVENRSRGDLIGFLRQAGFAIKTARTKGAPYVYAIR